MTSDEKNKLVLASDVERIDEAIAGDTGYVLQDVFTASMDALLTVCALALTTIDACTQDEESGERDDHIAAAQHAFSWLFAALRDMCEIPEENIRPLLYDRMVDLGTATAGAGNES